MNIGDRVRLLRAKEQGVVSRFLPGDMIEIEIEDGFRIPVMRSELVPVSPLEAERLLKTSVYAPQRTACPINSGYPVESGHLLGVYAR